jgi:hypothetical protein
MFVIADLSTTSPNAPGTVVGPIAGPAIDGSVTVNVDLSNYSQIDVEAKLTGATGGPLDVYLQKWDGVDWIDWAHFAQVAAGAAAISVSLLNVRVAASSGTFVTVGRNTAPALAAGATTGGHPGERLRVLFVAGASTTAGAAQTIRILGSSKRSNG